MTRRWIGSAGAVGKQHSAAGTVEGFHGEAADPFNCLVLVILFLAQQGGLLRRPRLEQFLGQRGALVGHFLLGVDQQDPPCQPRVRSPAATATPAWPAPMMMIGSVAMVP